MAIFMPRQIILLVINIFIKNGTSHNVDFFTLDPILLLLLLGAFRWCRQKLLSRPQLLTAQLQLRVRVELSLLADALFSESFLCGPCLY